ITSCHYQDAGAMPLQAAAYFFADAITYIEHTLARGLSIDSFAPRLSSYHYTHSDFFGEVAKYRAMRRLWARMMKERFGAQDPSSCMFRFGNPCGGSSLTAAQPKNNIVRVALEALASILGGTQAIHTGAWDEAYAIPTQESADLALKTQLILAHEMGVTQTVDPLGGSYYVEHLTNQAEAEIQQRLGKIELLGGMVRAIENGYIQREITDSAYERERQIQRGEKVVVGVNRFANPAEEEDFPLHAYDVRIPERQAERLRRIRQERSSDRVRRALDRLRQAAEGTENLMPYLIESVEAYATLGEITRVFREIFGEFREPVGI
ncbi:MAG: methylmalonyl-CoA mutase, partial [Candidatus Tectomicrobia bacterium]|nr:methylmalonyl-CoA mutase [Candidatus Tectomicrobia bacterium]